MPRSLPINYIRRRTDNPVDENHPSHLIEGFKIPSVSAEALATPVQLNIKSGPPVKRRGNRRNVGAELRKIAGNSMANIDAWAAQESAKVYKRVKMPSTLRGEATLRNFWISYLVDGRELTQEQAEATLSEGARPPDRGMVLQFMFTVATEGGSTFQGKEGWSYRTTARAFYRLLGMFNSAGVGSFSVDDIDNIRNASAIQKWGLELGHLHTEVKQRYTLRNVDYNALMAGIYGPNMSFESNFQRVQFALIMNLFWETGCRTGTFAEPDTAQGLAHCVRLGDCDLIFCGMSEFGPLFQLFLRFQYNKGQKLDRSEFTQTNIRSLPGPMALVDALVPFIAITCYNAVWDYDLLSLAYGTIETIPPVGFVIPLKEEFKTTSITRAGKPILQQNIDNEYQPPAMSKPDPQLYSALTMPALLHNIQKVQTALNWPHFIGKSMRYSWSTHMTGKLPENVLKYSLGHRLNSDMAAKVYQQPDRREDMQAHRHSLEHDTRMIDYHSSVSFASRQFQPTVQNSEIEARMQDARLAPVLDRFAKECKRFSELAGGRGFDEFLDSPEAIPEAAREAFDDAFDRYVCLCRKYNEVYHKEIDNAPSNEQGSSSQPHEIRPTSTSFQNSLSVAIDCMASAHPLSSLVVVDEARNARANLIKHYLNMFKHDELLQQKQCPICFDALGSDQEPGSLASHDNMAQHIFSCQKTTMRGRAERCNFCGVMVPSNDAEFVEHLEACYLDVLPKLLRKQDDFPLKHQITLYNDHIYTVIFCPYCLDVELNWDKRNFVTTGAPLAVAHLISHFKVKHHQAKAGETKPFLDGHNLNCWFVNCNKSNMTVPQAMSHLHSEHNYPLLTCLCRDRNHDHSKLEIMPTLIPGRMVLYEKDLKMLKEHPNGQPYINSQVCIVEHARRKPAQDASLKKLAAFLDSSFDELF